MSDIRSFVDTIFDELVSIRRDIHAHPELGMHEVRTSALIRSELEKMGVDEIRQPLPTAVVALIHGKKGPGKCVALRADIDALPVHEETGLPFASETEGIMHACGHDLHTTMLLGVAKTLCHMRDQFAGTVKLIFEPSEDLMPGGARALVAAGVMENPHVDAIFGQHVCPSENDSVGRMQLYKGYFTSAVDLFHITIHGKSGHGAAPHTARDAIACAGYLITVLQTVVSRRIDPMAATPSTSPPAKRGWWPSSAASATPAATPPFRRSGASARASASPSTATSRSIWRRATRSSTTTPP